MFRRRALRIHKFCQVVRLRREWSSRTIAMDLKVSWEMSVKIGAKIVRHGRYVIFQMAEVAIPRDLFADILRRIDRLRPTPVPA